MAMKVHRIVPRDSIDRLAGMVLCHDVGINGARLRKGRVLRPDDLAALRSGDWAEIHVIEIEPGDIHEDEAGRRLATAAIGDGVTTHAPSAGHWPLVATRRGILEVSIDALRQANMLDGILIYTLFDGQIVDVGEHVARAKIAPLVLEERLVADAERLAADTHGFLRVRPFHPRRIGAVAAETLGPSAADRIRATLGEKVSWFGSTLLEPAFVAPTEDALLSSIRDLVSAGAEVLLVAGTKAMDPLDPSWLALERFGVTVERFGVPAHPGSLFWIAWHGEIPIIGVPTCGLFTQASVFDLILPRLLAGERIGRAELAELGHGGFLTKELGFRFPPYRGVAGVRGEVEDE
jgi:hypothetical protein